LKGLLFLLIGIAAVVLIFLDNPATGRTSQRQAAPGNRGRYFIA